jgi:hypothetical protein
LLSHAGCKEIVFNKELLFPGRNHIIKIKKESNSKFYWKVQFDRKSSLAINTRRLSEINYYACVHSLFKKSTLLTFALLIAKDISMFAILKYHVMMRQTNTVSTFKTEMT